MEQQFNYALKYINSNPAKAELLFTRILKKHKFKEAYTNLAVAARNLGKFEKTKENLLLALDPSVPLSDDSYVDNYPIAYNNLGLLEHSFENDDKAEEYFLKALEVTPQDYDVLWNLSLSRLRRYCSGENVDLNEAWGLYNSRFKRKNPIVGRVDKALKPWDTKEKVESLVVLAEQGMGDMLMFSRYIKLLDIPKVWVQASSEFAGLYNNRCVHVSDSDATHAIPCGSLGQICDHIPDGEWLADKYIPKVGGDFNIVCNWAGSKVHANNVHRSIGCDRFLELSSFGNLYSIGPGKATKGFKHLHSVTWMETIKHLENIDLVITVDTSLAHLCGSLGKPCWVLMPLIEPDFRWGHSRIGYDNIWYKSVTVFRNNNNWDKVFEHVKECLRD